MRPSHPRLLCLLSLQPQEPSFHFLVILHHHWNTPNPPISSCLPMFWVGKSLWNKKLSATWGSRVTVCNTRNDSPWAAPGRDNLGGEVGSGDTEATLLSLTCCLCRWQQCFPQTNLFVASGKKAGREQLFCGCQDGHRKPSLRSQVSRTIHTEVNQPVVNKEKTVIKCVVSHGHNLLRI